MQVFNIPIVLVSLVDKERQWFKSVVGLPGASETDRKSSFCAWTLLPSAPECLVVSDARTDPRFRGNVLVTGPPHIQFYGGCPLVTSSGLRLGSFCVIDTHRRYFTTEDCNLLCNFAELAVRELEAARADDRRTFGDSVLPEDRLREIKAWENGVLVVRISASWFLMLTFFLCFFLCVFAWFCVCACEVCHVCSFRVRRCWISSGGCNVVRRE